MEEAKYDTQITSGSLDSATRAFYSDVEKFYIMGLTEDELVRLEYIGDGILQYLLMSEKTEEKPKFSLKNLFRRVTTVKYTVDDIGEALVNVLVSTIVTDEVKLRSMAKERILVLESNAYKTIGYCEMLIKRLGVVGVFSGQKELKRYLFYRQCIDSAQDFINIADKLFGGSGGEKATTAQGQPGDGE